MNHSSSVIDTHAHLDFPKFKDDRDEVVARAKEAGVGKIINATSYGRDFPVVRGIVEKYDNVWQLAGLHPYDTDSLKKENWFEDLKQYAEHEKVVAIGEIGLDFYEIQNTKEEQIKLFEPQLDLATELDSPVVLHIRDAFDEVYDLVKGRKLRGVVHCFSGNWAEAQRWLDLGYLISVTGIVTFPKTDELSEVVKNISLDKLMIETDAPFLAPQSHRGERCEPAYVKEVAEKIAELKEVSFDEVAKQTTKTAEEFFEI